MSTENDLNKTPGLPADMFFDDNNQSKKVSFDFVLWFYRILKHWYLFVISLAICLGYAYIKNKSWTPVYTTKALLVLETRGGGLMSNSNFASALIQNWVNQQMILSSYDMIVRTVQRLPQMQVFYFHSGKFNIQNLYGKTPIMIEYQYIGPNAYQHVYTISPVSRDKCNISVINKEGEVLYSVEVTYNEFIQENDFYIKITKTDKFTPNFTPFNFRFVTNGELINRYTNSVSTYFEREGSSALTVQKMGSNPYEDRDFLNALLLEYQEYNLLLKNEAADRSINFLEKQLMIIKDSLNISEANFRDFQNQTGIYGSKVSIDGSSGASSSGEIKGQLENVLGSMTKLREQETSLLQASDLINSSITNNVELPDPQSVGWEQAGLSELVIKYNTLVASMQRMGEAHPLYQNNKKDLDNIRLKILNELKKAQEKMQGQKDKLKQESADLESQMLVLPSQEREYIRYESEYRMNDTYNTYLTQKLREANLQKASNIPDNYILEAPRQVGGAINMNERTETYTFYFILGLAIPLLFVVCKEEIFNFTIATKEECEKLTNLPVIGAVENVSKKLNKGRAIVKNFPKSSFAESFRNMRIRIEYMAQKESNIIALVTSAEPADGKTFVAANIASIYQLTGRRVVLVDFDLRRPSVAKLLDIHSKRGVSNFLIGQVSLDEILITHPDYGFDVIPAGTLPPNPSELIKTKKTKDLIEYLHSKYDYVIIDCSPVGLVSDAYILAKFVDTTLFVVRRAKTNKSFFKSVVSQLKNDGIYNVGLVFNDVKGREGYYGTSRYYGDKAYYLRKNSYYHDDYFEK